MITSEKLSVYKSYDGDVDMWQRINNKKDQSIITGEDWHQIEVLLHELRIIKNGAASEEFENSINLKLKKCVSDNGVVNELRELA